MSSSSSKRSARYGSLAVTPADMASPHERTSLIAREDSNGTSRRLLKLVCATTVCLVLLIAVVFRGAQGGQAGELGDNLVVKNTLSKLPQTTDDDVTSYVDGEKTVSSGDVNRSSFEECLTDTPQYHQVDSSFDVATTVQRLAIDKKYVPLPVTTRSSDTVASTSEARLGIRRGLLGGDPSPPPSPPPPPPRPPFSPFSPFPPSFPAPGQSDMKPVDATSPAPAQATPTPAPTTRKLYEIPLVVPTYVAEVYGDLPGIQRELDQKQTNMSTRCGKNPLSVEATRNKLFQNTSASCDARMNDEVDAVSEAHKSCETTWSDIEDLLQESSDLSNVDDDHYSNLPALLTELKSLWQVRLIAGRGYDGVWQTWSRDESAARASCGYADHYEKLKDSISNDFIDKLKAKRSELETLCGAMPADAAFNIEKTTYSPSNGRHLLQATLRRPRRPPPRLGTADDDDVCKQILDKMKATEENVNQESTGRSKCLTYHCQQDVKKLGDTTLDIKQKFDTWKMADDNFTEAYEAYILAHDKYVEHLTIIFANNKTLESGKVGLNATLRDVDEAMEDLSVTASCAPSSICCVPPKEIPEICAQDAAGNVSKFADAVTFDTDAWKKFHVDEDAPPPPPPPLTLPKSVPAIG